MTRSDFEGSLAVVTGGASGIGEAAARQLAARGAKVAVTDIDRPAAERVAEAIGGSAWGFDVSNPEAVEAAAAEIEEAHGPVSVLVTSAGVLQPPLAPAELDISTWERITAVNQRGVWLCCKAFGERMAKRGRGAIVNIASVAGMRSMPLHAYSPTKAAVIEITACLATEWGRNGVRVNAVSPGFTATPAIQAAIDRGERDPAAIEASAAMGRMVRPEEVAEAIAFLASDAASAITGITLPVDCGWLVKPSWNTYGTLVARSN